MFRALAGLWRSGGGRILTPLETRIVFMPKRAYIPDLSLREILAYPAPATTYGNKEINAALARFDLDYLSAVLDRAGAWDKELADPERQAIAFARLLLRRPDFVVIDEAIDALSTEAKQVVADIFDRELKSSGLIYISGPRNADPLFARCYRLESIPTTET